MFHQISFKLLFEKYFVSGQAGSGKLRHFQDQSLWLVRQQHDVPEGRYSGGGCVSLLNSLSERYHEIEGSLHRIKCNYVFYRTHVLKHSDVLVHKFQTFYQYGPSSFARFVTNTACNRIKQKSKNFEKSMQYKTVAS